MHYGMNYGSEKIWPLHHQPQSGSNCSTIEEHKAILVEWYKVEKPKPQITPTKDIKEILNNVGYTFNIDKDQNDGLFQ